MSIVDSVSKRQRVGESLEESKKKLIAAAAAASCGGDLRAFEAIVNECCEREAVLNGTDENGNTVLHSAAEKGHVAIISWLLSREGRAAGFNCAHVKNSNEETALFLAVVWKHLEACKAIVNGFKIEAEEEERRDFMNAVDGNGRTVLHAAVASERSILQWVLSDEGGRAAGFNKVLARTKDGDTALHLAVLFGCLEVCQDIIDGCQVDNGERREMINAVNNSGKTVLHRAAEKGHTSIINWILSDEGGRRAGFNKVLDKVLNGETALHLSVVWGHLETCKAIVDGCRVDNGERREMLNAVDGQRRTVLHRAVVNNRPIVRWLLSSEKGGGRAEGFDNILAEDLNGETALVGEDQLDDWLEIVNACRVDNGERKRLLNVVDSQGRTVLHLLAEGGNTSIINWILSREGGRASGFENVLTRTTAGAVALHLAVQSGHPEACKAIVKRCRTDNGERQEMLSATNNRGRTALHLAAERGHLLVIAWLLSREKEGGRHLGFNSTFTKDSHGCTALHITIQHCDLASAQQILRQISIDERRELINGVDNKGNTILHVAVGSDYCRIIKWLLSNEGGRSFGFDCVTALTNEEGKSVLHHAVERRIEVVEALLPLCTSKEKMSLFLAVDHQGSTALHIAAQRGARSAIKELLSHTEYRMIVNRKDDEGMAVLHRAIIRGQFERQGHSLGSSRPPISEQITSALLRTSWIDPNIGLDL